jgi:putative transcriptional regulator
MSDAPLPEAGSLLVAHPRMLDPNFMHTVVLLCEHGADGAYGLVLNRPAPTSLGELGAGPPFLEGRTDVLWHGGPVQPDHLQFVHAFEGDVPGALEVAPGIHLGGDPDVLRLRLDDCEDAEPAIRFLLGYSGWSAEQLSGEFAEGAWIVCPVTPAFVFDHKPETLWRRVLRARGGPYVGLADLPPDPTWN